MPYADRAKNEACKRQWALDNPDKRRAANRKWQLRNPERHLATVEKWRTTKPLDYAASYKRSGMKQAYGTNALEHRQAMLKEQQGNCPLCLRLLDDSRRPSQDHDHKCCPPRIGVNGRAQTRTCGKCLRGILCTRCNQALGFVENAAWLQRAVEYVARWDKALYRKGE